MTTAATAPTTTPTTPPPIGHNGGPSVETVVTAAPAAPVVAADGTVTITLARPIVDKGKPVATLTLPPLTLAHKIASERASAGAAQSVALIAALAGVSEDAVRTLVLRDLRAIERAMRVPLDTARLPTTEPNAFGMSVTLSHPIATDAGAKVERLAIREPDVEASIAVEAVARNDTRNGRVVPLNPSEQTAAMIATLTGLTIPEIGRLRMVDVAAIEGWLLPFVIDTSLSEADGETSP